MSDPGRVSKKDLGALVIRINDTTGSPQKLHDGMVIMRRCYHLEEECGGWRLARGGEPVAPEGHISFSGFVSKRQVYGEMLAFLAGLEFKI